MLGRCALAFVVAALMLPAAMAGERKPDVSIATRVFKGSITIDERLRAYPRLHAFILAEASRELQAARNEARRAEETGELQYLDRRWRKDVFYDLRVAPGEFVSVLKTNSYFQSGAHGYAPQSALLWSRSTGNVARLADMFTESADGGPIATTLSKLVDGELTRLRSRNGVAVIPPPVDDPDTGPARLSDLDPSMTFAPSTAANKASGLTFHYAYIDSAIDRYVVFVPWPAIIEFVKPELRSLFGGERVVGDDDK